MSLQDGATDSMIFLSLFVGAKVELQTKGSKSAKIYSIIDCINRVFIELVLASRISILPT